MERPWSGRFEEIKDDFSHKELALTWHGRGNPIFMPSKKTSDILFAQSLKSINDFSPQGLFMLMCGPALLGVVPPKELRNAGASVIRKKFHHSIAQQSLNPQELVQLFWSYAVYSVSEELAEKDLAFASDLLEQIKTKELTPKLARAYHYAGFRLFSEEEAKRFPLTPGKEIASREEMEFVRVLKSANFVPQDDGKIAKLDHNPDITLSLITEGGFISNTTALRIRSMTLGLQTALGGKHRTEKQNSCQR